MVELTFSSGTVEIHGLDASTEHLLSDCRWDKRAACFRAPAMKYAAVVLALRNASLAYVDQARQYQILETGLLIKRSPRPFQTEALKRWRAAKGRGIVVLPTGAGKSYLALMAIDAMRRSTLIVAPTLDLVHQWYDLLRTSFGTQVGIIGGGEHHLEALTVTTYDSAYIHMEHIGARFGMVVYDECHHLPGETYGLSAQLCLAPFRLGLTATLERPDGRESDLEQLIGPQVFRLDITELSGTYLAEYETVQIQVELTPEERKEYEAAHSLYRSFLERNNIRIYGPHGWSDFIKRASRSSAGLEAIAAHRRQRQLAFAASAKLDYLDHLLRHHAHDRTLVFTQDNATAYEISRRFLIPVITHQTKITERSQILDGLKQGIFNAVVTSRVLNEGVDVPSANVAIVVSGSGSVREHVQRLGRVLRKHEKKQALLYELVTVGTSETKTSEKRREHNAYR